MVNLSRGKIWMKIEIVLKPCPWCDKTPEVFFPTSGDTWCWYIYCGHKECSMTPKSHYVAIRKTSKYTPKAIIKKLTILANRWNKGNPRVAREMKVIDLNCLDDIAKGPYGWAVAQCISTCRITGDL